MCEGGINADQLKFSLEQLDETVALSRRWTHKLFHVAEGKGRQEIADELKAAQQKIDEAMERIAKANKLIAPEDDAITVELV